MPNGTSTQSYDLSKLDPLLIVLADSADQETTEQLRRRVEEDVRALTTDRAGATRDAQSRPVSERRVPVALQTLTGSLSPAGSARLLEQDLVQMSVAVTSAEAATPAIEALGGEVETVTEKTLAVRLPRDKLLDLTRVDGLVYAEASVRTVPNMNRANAASRLTANARRVVSQTGKGVLVGIVDSGIDVEHAAFKAQGKYRVVDYLDQTTGRQYSEKDMNEATHSPDTSGHGTHVAGIAAGNGGGSPDAKYAGVAIEADLAVVKTTFDTTDILTGIGHILNLAARRKQPAVVNLSLGGHYGPHDGTTALERAIDQMSGAGRIVVISAGNEGQAGIHARAVLPPGEADARFCAELALRSREINGQRQGQLLLQVWTELLDDITTRLTAPTGETFTTSDTGQQKFVRGPFTLQVVRQRNEFNVAMLTEYFLNVDDQAELLETWQLEAFPGPGGVRVGDVNAWIVRREMGQFTHGRSQSMLVGMPGTAHSAITVGSYATRNTWSSADEFDPIVNMNGITLGEISGFSSPGPTRHYDTKPELSAPGQYIIAPLSSGASFPARLRRAGIPYVALQGTSMAAPYVTGTVALLLQATPELSWGDAKRVLVDTARRDVFTGRTWNPAYGFGKVDVARAFGG